MVYDHPGCRRTSNAVNQLMNRSRRRMCAELHGHLASSQRRSHGRALLFHFRPLARRSRQVRKEHCAHRLKGQHGRVN